MPALYETGEHESGDHRVAAARFAVAFVLIGLHLGNVVAAFRHADGWTQAIRGGCPQEIVETRVALKIAELHQLCGFGRQSNVGHLLLFATGARIIRAPDREAELRGILTAAVKRLPSSLRPQTTLREMKDQKPGAILHLTCQSR